MRPTLAGLILTVCLAGLTPAWSTAQTSAEQEFLFAYRLMQRGDLAEAGAAFDDFLRKFPQDTARGDALYFRAALYRQAGALRAAAELLEGVTGSAAPQRVPRYAVDLLRGQILTDLGEYERALTVLESVDEAELPARAQASVSLLRAMAYRGAGNFQAAARAAADAADRPGVDAATQARARLEQGRAQADAGDTQAARQSLDAALAADQPAVAAEAARLAGDVAYQSQDYDAAARYYQRVIENDQSSPQFPPAVVGRMWADLQAGRNVAVVNTHKQLAPALAARPDTVALGREADYLAASAYQNLGQQAQAVEMFGQVVADDPSPPTSGRDEAPTGVRALALYKLAVGQYELTRYDDMARTVAQLEREYPRSPQQIDASFLLASADANQGRAEAGVARLKSFIDDGPDNPYFAQALLRRAALLTQDQQYAPAAEDLSRYLDTAGPEADPAVRLRLVDLQHRLGEYDAAINTAGQVLADPRSQQSPAVAQEAWYRLGEAQTRAGKYRQALASFDTLQQEHPINPYRHAVDLRRGLLLQQLGRTDEAMAVLIESGNDDRLPTPQRVAALRIIASHLRSQQRDDDAALTLRRIEEIAGLESLDADELLWLARQELATDQPDGAREALRTLAAVDAASPQDAPDDEALGQREAELRFLRGRAHLLLGQLDEAYRNFFGVVALGRGLDLEARLYLARTETARGNLDAALMELSDLQGAADSRVQAEALYEKGLVHRQRAQLLTRRGDAAGAAEQYAQARGALKRMVLLYLTVDALRPLPARGLVQLAEIAQTLDEPEARDKELNELIRAFPDSPYTQFGRALLDQYARQRPDDALVRLQRLEPDPLDPVLQRWVDEKIAALEAMR